MAAVRSVTRIRFIVILESYFWCLFHGSVLLIMALSGQSVWGNGEYTCGLSIKWCPISLLLYIETTFIRYGHGPGGIFGIVLNEHALWHWTSIIVRDWQRTLLTWKSHLIRSRPPQRRVPFNNKYRRWWLVCYQRQAGDVCRSPWCLPRPESYQQCHREDQQQKCKCWRCCSDWRSPAARIRIGLSHMILPNDQEEGYYHEGRHEEARSGHKGTVWLRIDICEGDSIDEC